MSDLVEEFNKYFKGDAIVAISDNELKITIGSRTLIVSSPVIIGMDVTDSSYLP